MTKLELVEKISAMNPMLAKVKVEQVIDDTFAEIRYTILKEKRFAMPKFGTFTVRHHKARRGIHPQTGMRIHIPASRTVGFRPTPAFKEGL